LFIEPIGIGISADHPFQAGPLRIPDEEARVARKAVHRPPVAVSYVGTGRGERLGGRAASGAGASFAGLFGDYGVRWVR
jgi:hypothetical protein